MPQPPRATAAAMPTTEENNSRPIFSVFISRLRISKGVGCGHSREPVAGIGPGRRPRERSRSRADGRLDPHHPHGRARALFWARPWLSWAGKSYGLGTPASLCSRGHHKSRAAPMLVMLGTVATRADSQSLLSPNFLI